MFSSVNYLTDSAYRRTALVDRFEKEWNKTEKELKIQAVAKALLCLSIPIVIVCGLFIASTLVLPEIVGIVALVAITLLFGLGFLEDSYRKRKRRLEGEIFSEVITLPSTNNHDMDQDKLEVFKKFGKRCKNLRITEGYMTAKGPIRYALAVRVDAVFDWAIRMELQARRDDPATSNQKKASCRELIDVYQEISEKSGQYLQPFASATSQNAVYGAYDHAFHCRMAADAIEDEKSYTKDLNQENRAKLRAHKEACIKAFQYAPKESLFTVQHIAEMIESCPTAVINIDEAFQVSGAVKACSGKVINRECDFHSQYNMVSSGNRVNPCEFPSLVKLYKQDLGFKLLID